MPHPLDKPIWSALGGRQAHLNRGAGMVRRFPSEVSPFAAIETHDASAALAAAIPHGDEFSLLERDPPPAPDGVLQTFADCVQMIAERFPAGGPRVMLEPLGNADAAEMLALALMTRPGPFRARTHTLGRFLGVRDNGRLIAMGGERLAVEGFVEISALCTHPDVRGRGYGEALLRAVGQRILDDGDTPFLHSYAANAGAIALYEKLGFRVRAPVIHAIWRRAADSVSGGS
ncbi:MAG: GNAT family N-acetyltransferase [Alphaproteobacteria bacterium]|nr:GNAT family N-acetyltransferase [Alphaproteobacteria bacterium]